MSQLFLVVLGFITFALGSGACLNSIASQLFSRLTGITWALFSFCVSLWGFGLYMAFASHQYEVVLFWSRFLNIAAIFIPACFYHFVIAITKDKNYKSVWVIYGLTIAYFTFSISFPDWFVPSLSQKLGFLYYPNPGWLYYFFPIGMTMIVGSGVYRLWKKCRGLLSYEKKICL